VFRKANGSRPGECDDHYRYSARSREAQGATGYGVVRKHAGKRERFVDESGKGIILISGSEDEEYFSRETSAMREAFVPS
jgi:hypothetical protein